MDLIYRSLLNRDVKPAFSGEFAPVRIGEISIWPPVVLAPMAGVTNYPFRSICKEFGAGLYVSEMINARPLVDGRDKTLKLADFGPDESPRSLQRSEEHTSELQSRGHLVCRLLLEKKNKTKKPTQCRRY